MNRKWMFISLLFLFFSCQPEFDQQAYLKVKLDKKIERLKKKELIKCKVKAEEDAQAHIDSLINQWISKDLLDTIKFPNRPIKPGMPGHIIEQWQDPKEKILNEEQ